MSALLKTQSVTFAGVAVPLFELSALHYVDYLDYVNELSWPEDLAENSSEKDQVKALQAARRVNLQGNSRLVAYGLGLSEDADINTAQKQVQTRYTLGQIKEMHDVVAKLSGDRKSVV